MSVSEHGFSEPKFRGSSIPDTRNLLVRERKVMESFKMHNPQQPKAPLKVRIKRKGRTFKSSTQDLWGIKTPEKTYGKAYGEPEKSDRMTQKEYNFQKFQ